MEKQTILLERITKKPNKAEFSNIPAVLPYVESIQQPFLSMLAFAAGEKRFSFFGARRKNDTDRVKIGWEHVKDGKAIDEYQNGFTNSTSVFTGSTLCAIASFALCDGLRELVDKNLQVDVYHTNVFFNKTYEGGLTRKPVYGDHVLVKITDTQTDDSYYIDPTYAQINPEWAGKFLIIPVNDLGLYYTTHTPNYLKTFSREMVPLQQNDLLNVNNQREQQLKYLIQKQALTDLNYRALVMTVSPTTLIQIGKKQGGSL